MMSGPGAVGFSRESVQLLSLTASSSPSCVASEPCGVRVVARWRLVGWRRRELQTPSGRDSEIDLRNFSAKSSIQFVGGTLQGDAYIWGIRTRSTPKTDLAQ